MAQNYDLRGNTLQVDGVETPTGGALITTSTAQTITGVKNFSGGLRTKQAVNNVHDTAPTKAELTTSFGDPATIGRGFVGTVDDNDGNTNAYLVFATDADYFYLKFTKAT